jgi:hypothetical protein
MKFSLKKTKKISSRNSISGTKLKQKQNFLPVISISGKQNFLKLNFRDKVYRISLPRKTLKF